MTSEPKRFYWLLANAFRPLESCVLWPFTPCNNGYGQLRFNKRSQYAHRLVCQITHGPAPSDKHQAAHECGNTRCVNYAHIKWKTPRDNQLDRPRHGTEKWAKYQLTAETAAEIRAAKGIVNRLELAARYGVTEATIRQIHTGKTWKSGNSTIPRG